MIRGKVKEDFDFRRRLLDYIENVAREYLPQDVNCGSDWMEIYDVADADAGDEL